MAADEEATTTPAATGPGIKVLLAALEQGCDGSKVSKSEGMGLVEFEADLCASACCCMCMSCRREEGVLVPALQDLQASRWATHTRTEPSPLHYLFPDSHLFSPSCHALSLYPLPPSTRCNSCCRRRRCSCLASVYNHAAAHASRCTLYPHNNGGGVTRMPQAPCRPRATRPTSWWRWTCPRSRSQTTGSGGAAPCSACSIREEGRGGGCIRDRRTSPTNA